MKDETREAAQHACRSLRRQAREIERACLSPDGYYEGFAIERQADILAYFLKEEREAGE